MIGIRSIASYLPPDRVNAVERGRQLGFDEKFVTGKLGFAALSRKSPAAKTSDLAVAAIHRLERDRGMTAANAKCVVVVTQNPDDDGLPHTSAIVHRKLGLSPSCFAFDISLGCSGYVAGLAAVIGFMHCAGVDEGLLITADPYSAIVDPDDRNTALIFGDAATVTLLASDPVFVVGNFDLGTVGAAADALRVADGRLSMNGRAVFDFAAREIPASVERVIASSGLTKDDVDRFIFHPGSRYVVDTIARRLAIDSPPFPSAAYGNTVSSSLPLMLEELINGREQVVLLSGFGVGLGWATTILRRV